MIPQPSLPSSLYAAIIIVLSGTALPTHAQTFTELPITEDQLEYQDARGAADVNERLSRLHTERSPSTDTGSTTQTNRVSTSQTQLFLECQDLEVSAARLACYDKVASQGRTPAFTMTKKPVDLAKTLKSTFSGKPKVVLADERAEAGTSDTDTRASLVAEGAAGQTDVLDEVGVTQTDIEKYTPLSLAYDLDQNSERGTWTVRPYRPNYILPLFYTLDPNLSPTSSSPDVDGKQYTSNDVRNTELKFQLSLKTKVAEDLFDTNADLWFGYTQQAHWQVYNEDNSRPFRATDYQPEIFLTQPVTADLPFDGRVRMLGAGVIHHSNGRSDPLSRSWNRAYLMSGAEWGKLSILPRLWVRINNESDSSEDNPDIEDYLGYGDIKFLYDLPKEQSIGGTLRYNPSSNKGAAQLDYIYPLSKNVKGYVQLFHGYGESIIDYDYENISVGVGIVLNDWRGF